MPLKSELILFFLFLPIIIPTHSTSTKSSSSINRSIAHCECRCCHHIMRLQKKCDDQPKKVPLSPSISCDSPMKSSHDQSVCGIPLCQANFPDLCSPPSFITHACVSDRGAVRDWLPIVFGCVTLFALALVFRTRAAAGPIIDVDHPDEMEHPFKRDPLPSPPVLMMQPLMSAQPHRSYDGIEHGLEIVDVGPRSPILAARAGSMLPPMSGRAHSTRSGSMSRLEDILPPRGKAFTAADMDMRRSTGDIWGTVTGREVT